MLVVKFMSFVFITIIIYMVGYDHGRSFGYFLGKHRMSQECEVSK